MSLETKLETPRYIRYVSSVISLAMLFATATIAVPFPGRNEFNLLLRSTDASTVGTATKAGPVVCVTYNNEAGGGESPEDETGGEGSDTAGEEKGDMAKNDGAPSIGRDGNLTSRASSMAMVESAAKVGPVKVCVTLSDQQDEDDVFDDGSIPPQELETEILKSVCCGSPTNSVPESPDSDVQAFCKQILDKTPNVCKN